jgi:hypothetical protein
LLHLLTGGLFDENGNAVCSGRTALPITVELSDGEKVETTIDSILTTVGCRVTIPKRRTS